MRKGIDSFICAHMNMSLSTCKKNENVIGGYYYAYRDDYEMLIGLWIKVCIGV